MPGQAVCRGVAGGLARVPGLRQAPAMRKRTPLAVAVATVVAGAGCQPMNAYVDGAHLPDADGVIAVEPGPTLVIKPDTDVAALAIPQAGAVRLAIDRAVPWPRVETLIQRVAAAGARPVFLVGVRDKIHAFRLNDTLAPGDRIRLLATSDGKACVGKTGVDEMRCFQGSDRRYVHRAFVRENVREAVKEYELHDVEVRADPSVEWANVVRAIDGARTCCGKTEVRAALMP